MAKFVKKAATKSVEKKPIEVKKNGAKKIVTKVPEAMVFWCHDGQIFNDLDQLIAGFDLMTDETFMYHANENKNDFSCWIIDVIGDKTLGDDIKKAKNKTEAKKITEQRYYDLTKLEG